MLARVMVPISGFTVSNLYIFLLASIAGVLLPSSIYFLALFVPATKLLKQNALMNTSTTLDGHTPILAHFSSNLKTIILTSHTYERLPLWLCYGHSHYYYGELPRPRRVVVVVSVHNGLVEFYTGCLGDACSPPWGGMFSLAESFKTRVFSHSTDGPNGTWIMSLSCLV